nr:endolytic transglycosylase MltG [Alphaproteobacteria bacterium]
RCPAPISRREVLALLNSGKTVVRRLTVVEGTPAAETIALLNAVDGLSGDIERQPDEGELLPETYHFSFGDSRAEVVDRMAGAMKRTLAELWPGRAPDLPLKNQREAVVLASLIEKETGQADERARVAAVFVNRLKRGMRLQSDPTVVYALTEGKGELGRTLTRADLKTPSPFNTYVIKGLPPGPICNPGRESLVAALHPANTKELYFVADGTGGHLFAGNLAQHNRNVARWRKIRKQQKK